MKLFFDGGCRPNPGTMEIAVVAAGRATVLPDIGHGTSEDAEWLALIHALTVARSLDARDVVLLGDAIDVIAKASGKIECHGATACHLERFRALASDMAPPRLRYVKRSQNLAGIALARLHAR